MTSSNGIRVLIVGAGRMGIRHALGIKSLKALGSAVVIDINQASLDNARAAIADERFSFCLTQDAAKHSIGFDFCVIAATAGNRVELLAMAAALGCREILVEKPLGQNIGQVKELAQYAADHKINCAVNLNMRQYASFIQLKKDLADLPQFNGEKTITINTGTLGIGANGIHYLDLLYFLLDADRAVILAASIDDTVIPSGRGPQFCDFGGWAVIDFFKGAVRCGTVMISMSATSTVFGAWEITGPNGRIYFNEVEGKRIDTLRKPDSAMPVNRYFADYLPPSEQKLESPFLGDLTADWITNLLRGNRALPSIDESIRVHQLMFDWLGKSKKHFDIYPIT